MSDDLVRRAKQGDRSALEALIERHMPAVYRLTSLRLSPDDPAVDDVVQEALSAAVGTIGRLRGETEGALVAWLLTITRHKVADHLRSQYAGRVDPVDTLPESTGAIVAADEMIAAKDRRTLIREALAELTSEQEEIIVLKFVLGYDNDEVAAITGRTVGAVKAMQHRGLARLKRLIGAEGAIA